MKKTIILLTLLVMGLGVYQTVQAEKLTAEALQLLADRYQYFIVIPPMGEEPLRYLYADIGPHVHVYDVVKGKAEAVWETGNLGAPVTSLLFTDLDKSGQPNIIVSTLNGRLIAYDGMNYERVWENFQEPFKSITCMTTHNIDGDPQDEVIIIGESALSDGSFIFIYDSVTRGLEWKSQENFVATEILVGNADSDPQPELILNSGFVIDSRFYNIDLIKRERGGFGNHLSLQDLNDDGYPEIIGRVPNRSLQIYDLYAERDIW
jgi:hypothetical protein